jgi:hypothetical protein
MVSFPDPRTTYQEDLGTGLEEEGSGVVPICKLYLLQQGMQPNQIAPRHHQYYGSGREQTGMTIRDWKWALMKRIVIAHIEVASKLSKLRPQIFLCL